KKTTPNVFVSGGDENFSELNGYSMAQGRDLNKLDVYTGRNVCVIGDDIVKKFFGGNADLPLEKIMKINGIPYRVIGVLASKGSTLGLNWDKTIITSYNNVRRLLNTNANASFNIQVKVADVKLIDGAIGE